ncbi:IS3 family transposase [Brassicibacter mesophilus]|uniref:IS3 family transposase n=1 Tax=Brassicibacter mesophilus TaxID=745119 RepID=UPI003D21B119
MKEVIKEVFDENKSRYGSIRIGKVLEQLGIHINRNQISRLMCEMNLCPKGTRYNYKKYSQKNRGEEISNLLNQMFVTNTKSCIFMLSISAFILLLQSF